MSASKAAIGSSKRMMSGLRARVRAIATLCFSPPESKLIFCFFLFFRETSDNKSLIFLSLILLLVKVMDSKGRETLLNTVSVSNNLKSWKRKQEDISDYELELFEETKEDNTINIVLNLPEKYKTVIYLYYYEGYSSIEIAKAIDKKESTVRSLLKRGRDILKIKIGGEFDEEF